MKLTIISLPLVYDGRFSAEVELQKFRNNRGNNFSDEQEDEEERETQSRNNEFPLLDVFRIGSINQILCVFPRPSVSTCHLNDPQLLSLMTMLANLHRSNRCIWPRKLCDSILIDESDADKIYLVGAGLYQTARVAPFRPEKDVEELREWLIRSKRLDDTLRDNSGLSSLLDLHLHFALQARKNDVAEKSTLVPDQHINGMSGIKINDQGSDQARRFIWSYCKEYLRICLKYDLKEMMEGILQDTVHPLPSAIELYLDRCMANQDEGLLQLHLEEFVFDLSKDVIFGACSDIDSDRDHELKDNLVRIDDVEQNEYLVSSHSTASTQKDNPVQGQVQIDTGSGQQEKSKDQQHQSKKTESKKQMNDNVLPTGEITQKLTDFLFRSFGGGDPTFQEEGQQQQVPSNVQKSQEQSTKASSPTLSTFLDAQSNKELVIEDKKGVEDQPKQMIRGNAMSASMDGLESDPYNVDEDVQRLEGYFFNRSKRRFHLLDKEYFAMEKLPRLEIHLAKFGSLPAFLRREIWTEIGLVQLGGWSRQVFWHILELTNADEDHSGNKQHLLDQLKKDLPRCHSYMTNAGLQQSIERILVAWECFDWKQYELHGLTASEDDDAAGIREDVVNKELRSADMIDADAINDLKQRLIFSADDESSVQQMEVSTSFHGAFADSSFATSEMGQVETRRIVDEFDVRDLAAIDEPESNDVGSSNIVPNPLEADEFLVDKKDALSKNIRAAEEEDIRWDDTGNNSLPVKQNLNSKVELFNEEEKFARLSTNKKRHLDEVLEEMPSHSLFQAQANALGFDPLKSLPQKRRMNDMVEHGLQFINPFAVDELLNDEDEDLFAINNSELATSENLLDSIEQVQKENQVEQLLVDVDDHVVTDALKVQDSDEITNPFWEPNDCMDESAAIFNLEGVESTVAIPLTKDAKKEQPLVESPIPNLREEEVKSHDRKPKKKCGRSYWQGMDSICAAMLVACEMDEVAALSVLNYVTEVVFKGKVFVQDTQGIEELGLEVKCRLGFFHPRLLNHLTRLCEKEGESLTVMLLPWLLTCFCHVLPLSFEHDNVLLMLLDWMIVGRISVTELVSAVLVQLSNDLLACKELTDVKQLLNRLSSNVHVDMSKLFKQSVKACEAMQTFTAGRDTFNFGEKSHVAQCNLELHLLAQSSLASQCLLVSLISDTMGSTPISLQQPLERLSIRIELLKGMDLERDGKIITDSITRARDAKSKRVIIMHSEEDANDDESLRLMLARVLVQREVPYVCVLSL